MFGKNTIRERSNADNIFTNYDGLEDIDMVENWGDLKEGTWQNFDAFKAFYAEHGHSLSEYEQLMDCQEFINLMAMNLYFNNLDFPGNNIMMWRPRTEGGKWRFVAKDTEYGMGLYNDPVSYKILQWLYNPQFVSACQHIDKARLAHVRPTDESIFRKVCLRTHVSSRTAALEFC